jgi:glycosyltransferase 2 family protein
MPAEKHTIVNINSIKGRKILNWVGLGLGIAGIVFIVLKFKEYDLKIDFSSLSPSTWLIIFSMVLVYFSSCFLLAFAWHNILLYLNLRVQPAWSIRTYGISQLAKYIPGNIFQFASRQAIGVSEGLPGIPLAKSIFWELLLIASSGVLFGVLILPMVWRQVSQILSIALFLASGCAYFFIMYKKVNRWIGLSVGYYLAFLCISGCIFLVIARTISVDLLNDPRIFLIIGGAYVFAWLVGLITPGAPAGAGVREAVIFLLLFQVLSQQDLLLAIILTRVVTILGDVFFYLFALVMKPSKTKST